MAEDILSVLTGLLLCTLGAHELLKMYRGNVDPMWVGGARKSNTNKSIDQPREARINWLVIAICFAMLSTGIWATVAFSTKIMTAF
jgi:hypothetical protein